MTSKLCHWILLWHRSNLIPVIQGATCRINLIIITWLTACSKTSLMFIEHFVCQVWVLCLKILHNRKSNNETVNNYQVIDQGKQSSLFMVIAFLCLSFHVYMCCILSDPELKEKKNQNFHHEEMELKHPEISVLGCEEDREGIDGRKFFW